MSAQRVLRISDGDILLQSGRCLLPKRPFQTLGATAIPDLEANRTNFR